MRSERSAPSSDIPPAAIRAELERILASEIFARSDRLSAFLEFIVEQTLSGQGDTLKEQVIAAALYGKGADFNTAADPIVRVDARRLRDRLREYYSSDPDNPVVVSVPKGSYTPVFALRAAKGPAPALEASAAQPASPARVAGGRGMSRRWWMLAGALALVGFAMWRVAVFRGSSAPPTRLLTVTSFPGSEEDPSLSPDGNFVAFSWSGTGSAEYSYIWIKAVDGDSLRRLTDAPEVFEKYPAWSPDGRYIAFSRMVKGRSRVIVVSALGGQERVIADQGDGPSWLPDGKSLVMMWRAFDGQGGLVHQVLETGARRTLTQAPETFRDTHPRVSPDGTAVAFERTGSGRSGLFVISIDSGTLVQVGEWHTGIIGGLCWTPDGRELLFARRETSGRRLFRVAANGRNAAVAISGLPVESIAPSVSRSRGGQTYRLALVSGQPDMGLRMVDLRALQGGAAATDAPFCDATRMDMPGRFSADGAQVAFVSDRGGSQQVWIAARDGSALRSVTHLQNAAVNVGSWSPNGQWVAFDATTGGNTDIYVARTDGGPVKRLTSGAESERDPEWSRDGRWIYYASSESGRSEIWRMSASGGDRVRLTSEGGFDPRASPDGRSVYFVDTERGYGLWHFATLERIPVEGGPATVVYSGISPGAWEITDAGVIFLMAVAPPAAAAVPDVLALLDPTDHSVRPLRELGFGVARFGTRRFVVLSRDAQWALASHIDRWERDIYVVDNFR